MCALAFVFKNNDKTKQNLEINKTMVFQIMLAGSTLKGYINKLQNFWKLYIFWKKYINLDIIILKLLNFFWKLF